MNHLSYRYVKLLDEVRSLIWLGLITNRAVIIPNLFGNMKISNQNREHHYKQQAMWPGFRIVKLKRENKRSLLNIDILEPG
jgi:hypothetical protein